MAYKPSKDYWKLTKDERSQRQKDIWEMRRFVESFPSYKEQKWARRTLDAVRDANRERNGPVDELQQVRLRGGLWEAMA